MSKINVHLHFDGRCWEALQFYEKCLEGKISFSMTWGESPAAKEVSGEWGKKIIHASLEFDGHTLTADDAPPGSYAKPQGFEILLSYADTSAAERVFKALSEKGKVKMPFGKTFWAEGFGMAEDPYGVPWMISGGGLEK